ncbi:hypothetical protein AB6A40_003514 [Gnathostoma spinigerum]|uniref:Uncharacterized protein n=1 Tax=Gnathostoma spinigerum TaxID=75299 RepID=A0ABD6E9S8_9BILA
MGALFASDQRAVGVTGTTNVYMILICITKELQWDDTFTGTVIIHKFLIKIIWTVSLLIMMMSRNRTHFSISQLDSDAVVPERQYGYDEIGSVMLPFEMDSPLEFSANVSTPFIPETACCVC